jgi:hypothetical protein
MDLYQALRLQALRAVMCPDKEYFIRRTLRWYSKTFHTPLHEVEDIPLEVVLQAFYEEHFEAMSQEDREAERQDLLVTKEQRYKQILAEEAEEAELFEIGKILAAEEEKKRKEASTKKTEQIAEIQHKTGPILPMPMPETDLPSGIPTVLPEGISMSFADDADFDIDSDGLGAEPKK